MHASMHIYMHACVCMHDACMHAVLHACFTHACSLTYIHACVLRCTCMHVAACIMHARQVYLFRCYLILFVYNFSCLGPTFDSCAARRPCHGRSPGCPHRMRKSCRRRRLGAGRRVHRRQRQVGAGRRVAPQLQIRTVQRQSPKSKPLRLRLNCLVLKTLAAFDGLLHVTAC